MFLALEHPVEADVVVGVPDSGIDAAIGFAQASGIPYGVGMIKNKYIGRTFIAPGQKNRENKVRIKLNPISATVKGKRVVLIDDSIVYHSCPHCQAAAGGRCDGSPYADLRPSLPESLLLWHGH